MKRKKIKLKSKKTSKELRKYAKKLKAKSGIDKRRKFINLTCNRCKREYHIHVNNIEIYTKKVIENYVCLLCQSWRTV